MPEGSNKAQDVYTVEGKKKFVRDLTERVTEEVLRDVEKMPDSWDGLHLRVLLAARFKGESDFEACKYAKREIKRSGVKYELSRGYDL